MTIIESRSQLEQLLSSKECSLTAVTLKSDALYQADLIVQLLQRHQETLKVIILDMPQASADYIYPKEGSKAIACAIAECSNLETLAIENFRSVLRDGIEFFTAAIKKLPKLQQLSFKRTHLGCFTNFDRPLSEYTQHFMVAIATSSLQVIDFTQSFISHVVFQDFSKALEESRSLEQVILGDSPIWSENFAYVANGVSSSKTIKKVDWQPPDYQQSERLYQQLLVDSNWCNDPQKNIQIDNEKQRDLESESSKAKHQKVCTNLRSLQQYLVERHQNRPVMKLVLNGDQDNNLHLIAAKIALHAKTLKSLEVDNFQDVILSDEGIEKFVKALRLCNHLDSFKLTNLEGTFRHHIKQVICALHGLPCLQSVSFKKTYLYKPGMEALSQLLQENSLRELDITLAGLLNDQCFHILKAALLNNTSLREIILGRSPLRASWINMMRLAVAPKFDTLKITWQLADQDEMKIKMMAMVEELVAVARRRTDGNGEQKVAELRQDLKIFLSQSFKESLSEWDEFQKCIVQQKENHSARRRGGFLENNPKEKNRTEIEMQSYSEETQLLSAGNRNISYSGKR